MRDGTSAFCTVNGATLHFRVTGAGAGRPWLVLVNSLGTDLRIWDGVVAALGDRFAILAYDKRGHGLSDLGTPPYTIADHSGDLLGLIDLLDIPTPIVCGVSVGGQIALEAALSSANPISGLVLSNTAARIGSAEFWAERISRLEAVGIAGMAESLLERWFSPKFREQRPDALAGYRNMLVRQPLDGYLGTCAALRDFDRTADTGRLSLPVSCIAGSQDGAAPPEIVRGLSASIPGANFHLIDDVGHLPSIEAPEQVAAVIEELATRAGSSTGAH